MATTGALLARDHDWEFGTASHANILQDDNNYTYNSLDSSTNHIILFDFPISIPSNATITKVIVSCAAQTYGSSSSSVSKSLTDFKFATAIKGVSQYTEIDGTTYTLAAPIAKTKTTYTYTIDDPSSTLITWMNNNKSKVAAGSNFGFRFGLKYAKVYWAKLEIEYTIPPSSSIYVGGSQVSEVYVGGTKATAVYIGSTRVL